MQPSQFKPVPFYDEWIAHEKIDVHAIYRRPILADDGEQLLDGHGVPQWDLTGGLPMRRHHDWVRKGYQYVTLADSKSLANKIVQQLLRRDGLNAADFIMLRNRVVGTSPWNPKLYLASQQDVDRQAVDKLAAAVAKFGSAAVLETMQLSNPTFQLPLHLRDIPPGGTIRRQTTTATISNTGTLPVAPRFKLGPEPGDQIPVCAHCGGPLGEHASATVELPGVAFCSDPCLKAALPKVAKNSLLGRQRKKEQKRAARGGPRPAVVAGVEA